MPFTAGLQVGPYRIMEQLGQGGMATVYQAYHASLDRYVAIKVLHQAFMEDPSFLARFQREARVVAKLEHPNIVPIYDYAEYEGQPYLVMKFIEGETLKARLQRGPLSAGEVGHMVETVGLALTYAHKQGILHRDIKPSNVILANDGQVYLADFGLARIAQSGESTLTTDMVLGTPQYISPEQAMAKKDLDEGTDIYSFGVMIYEMTVGRVPFSGDTPFSVIHDHIYSPLPLPSAVNPNIPPDLERFLLKALSKERADRFKDVPDMVKAFKEAWTDTASAILRAEVPAPKSEAVTVPPVVPAPISPPARADTGPVTPPPAAASQTFTQAEKHRSRATWIWIAAGLGLCLCCGVVFLALQANKNKDLPALAATEVQSTASPTGTAIPPTVAPSEEATVENPPTIDPANVPRVDLPQISVDRARQQMEQNPNDPKAHLQYGYALIQAGQQLDGYDQIRQGAELAHRNQLFLAGAAKTFEDAKLWLAAALLYMQMAENSRQMPNVLVNSLHQAVYRGFAEAHAPDVLEYSRIGRVDQALGLIAQARYTLTNTDKTDLAQTLINQVNALKPGLSDTKLLKAELLLKEGKTVEGQSALQNLIDALGTPAWIKDYAQELLHIPQ